MTGVLIGYARCSTDEQDLTAQRDRLRELGVPDDRVYLDHGLTGTNRQRPGLDQALAAVRSGDTLVVPKLDRLARSVPDARAIGDDLAARGIKLSLTTRTAAAPVLHSADPVRAGGEVMEPGPSRPHEPVEEIRQRLARHRLPPHRQPEDQARRPPLATARTRELAG